jgi:hypothetical protein
MNFDIDRLLGMSELDAELLCQHYNYSFRVTAKDGRYSVGTSDYRMDRVNATIIAGRVVKVDFG